MAGIVAYGGYVPALRMERKVMADAWGRGSLGGERSFANNDEDTVTMAVEAAVNCLHGRRREEVDGVFFASTTAPYQEKLSATLVGTVVDLGREVVTADFANSLRSGTGALMAALNAVACGSSKHLLVTAADYRLGYPRSDFEQSFGDGAAALLVGAEDLVATFEGAYCVSDEMLDVWRNPEDQYVKSWEGRFVLGEGYTAHMKEVVAGVLKKYGLKAGDIAKAVLPAPDGRTHTALAKALGFDVETQLQDPLLAKVGHCGAAQPLLMLSAALEAAKPGDLLLVGAYGDGADALLFKVTERIGTRNPRRSMRHLLENKLPFRSYARFLSYRGILEGQPGEPFRLFPSATVSWRERASYLRCHASRCTQCGTTTYPIQRVCYACGSKDAYEEVRISDRLGKVFTFTRDNLGGRSDDPVVVQTVAELDGGVRFYGLMTDCDPEEVELGLPVDLTFRRLYEGAGFHNYFWKLRPLRKGGTD